MLQNFRTRFSFITFVKKSLLLYSTILSNRLAYICNTIFGNHITLTSNVEAAKAYTGLLINYSNNKLSDAELHICPNDLLFEVDLKPQIIECFNWSNTTAFFKTTDGIGFDVLAASFYLISRYEEYTCNETDEHHSFFYKNSIAFKANFLQTPLVNVWWKKLQHDYPQLQLAQSTFTFCSTFDIDIAYKYKHHAYFKNIASSLKELLTFKFDALILRWKTFFKSNINDPYDVFNWLESQHQQYNIQAIYFCMSQLKRSKYDVNLSIHNKGLKQLYHSINKTNQIGIHPSYNAGLQQLNGVDSSLKSEIQQLQSVLQQPIKKSRQHYLVMQLPHTYNTLIANNIKEDFSLGYNGVNGFRASYCKPFYWFNLHTNNTTNLLLHPFCAMDSNYFFFKNYTQASALTQLKNFYHSVKQYDGELVIIFHNHFNENTNNKINWKELYQQFLAYTHTQKF